MISRSDVYAHLSRAVSFPEAFLHAQARDGLLAERLAAALARLPYRLRCSDLAWRAPPTYDTMQSEYIRLFQVGGRRGPPCPLHGGHYTLDRGRELHQLIRFYNYFGFRLSEGVMPDHLSVELEFMARLAEGGLSDEESLLRAQRDFSRHLEWVATLADRVKRSGPAPLYRSLTTVAARLVAADRRFLRGAAPMGVSAA
jgi:DMSO reductase family type II enzyme chaperone